MILQHDLQPSNLTLYAQQFTVGETKWQACVFLILADCAHSLAAADERGQAHETCYACRSVPKEVLNIEGALYFCTFFLGIINSLIVQPVLAAERTVFYRERAAHMYSVLPYVLSLVRPFRHQPALI